MEKKLKQLLIAGLLGLMIVIASSCSNCPAGTSSMNGTCVGYGMGGYGGMGMMGSPYGGYGMGGYGMSPYGYP